VSGIGTYRTVSHGCVCARCADYRWSIGSVATADWVALVRAAMAVTVVMITTPPSPLHDREGFAQQEVASSDPEQGNQVDGDAGDRVTDGSSTGAAHGHGGVFTVRVDDDPIYHRSQGFDIERLLAAIEQDL
jgi:hypothetical protein